MEMMINQKDVGVSHQTQRGSERNPLMIQKALKSKQNENRSKAEWASSRITESKKLVIQEEDSDNGSQVSFEQDLLQQHLTVINEKIEIYQICSDDDSAAAHTQGKQQKLKILSLQQHLVQNVLPSSPNNPAAQHFMKYLQKQNKFRNYLRHIYYTSFSKISNQLVQLVFLIWNLYMPCTIMGLNLEEIRKMAIMISKKLRQKQQTGGDQTQKTHSSEKTNNPTKYRFYYILTMTTILVIQKIFKNPFYSSKSSESQGEDQEAEIKQNQKGKKVIKVDTTN